MVSRLYRILVHVRRKGTKRPHLCCNERALQMKLKQRTLARVKYQIIRTTGVTSALSDRFNLSREGDSACVLYETKQAMSYDQLLYFDSIVPIRVSSERVDRVELISCT